MPTAGGVWKALERGRALGCEAVQIFVKNNMQWLGRPHSAEELARYTRERHLGGFHSIFAHAGYLINLAAPAGPNRTRSLESLLQEIHLADALGLPFLVLHPGSHLGQGEQFGIKQVVSGLNEVFRATQGVPVRIALENTAGQGSCLGQRFEHLAAIFDGVEQPARLGLCLDTAHLFEAGHDPRTPQGWNLIIRTVDRLVGLEQILGFHLNDSKTDLGSRVDRHEHIGRGKIGREAFRHIVNDRRFRNHPGCLETPKSPDLHEDRENLEVLLALRRSTAQGLRLNPIPDSRGTAPGGEPQS